MPPVLSSEPTAWRRRSSSNQSFGEGAHPVDHAIRQFEPRELGVHVIHQRLTAIGDVLEKGLLAVVLDAAGRAAVPGDQVDASASTRSARRLVDRRRRQTADLRQLRSASDRTAQQLRVGREIAQSLAEQQQLALQQGDQPLQALDGRLRLQQGLPTG